MKNYKHNSEQQQQQHQQHHTIVEMNYASDMAVI